MDYLNSMYNVFFSSLNRIVDTTGKFFGCTVSAYMCAGMLIGLWCALSQIPVLLCTDILLCTGAYSFLQGFRSIRVLLY